MEDSPPPPSFQDQCTCLMFNVLKITIPHVLFRSWACTWQRKQKPAISSCPGVEAPFLLKSRAAYLLLSRYDPLGEPFPDCTSDQAQGG